MAYFVIFIFNKTFLNIWICILLKSFINYFTQYMNTIINETRMSSVNLSGKTYYDNFFYLDFHIVEVIRPFLP